MENNKNKVILLGMMNSIWTKTEILQASCKLFLQLVNTVKNIEAMDIEAIITFLNLAMKSYSFRCLMQIVLVLKKTNTFTVQFMYESTLEKKLVIAFWSFTSIKPTEIIYYQ